jgi:hypothetical protein
VNKELRLADIMNQDGSAHTIMLAETTEQLAARWIYGVEMVLCGFPGNTASGQTTTLTQSVGQYYAPAGFNGDYGDQSTVTDRCYLGWDWPPDGVDPAYTNPVHVPAASQCTVGPSSDHPAGINHLFADGTVRTLGRDTDVAVYFFVITRQGGDPSSEYFNLYGTN